MSRLLACLLLCSFPLLLPAAEFPGPVREASSSRTADEEIVREFKRYFKKYKDRASRVEAVLALEGTESVEVVEVLLPVLEDEEPDVVSAAVRVLAGFKTAIPVARLIEELGSKKQDEAIRIGLLRVFEIAAYPGAAEAIASLLEDKSWEIRRRAVRALVAAADERAPLWIEPLCADPEPAVRCAALDGLGALRSERVLPHALGDLSHEVWQVRACAIHALGQVRHRDSIGPLIGRLEMEDGRLRQDIAGSLAELTGRDFGERVELWKSFWERNAERFEIPTDEQLAKLRAAQAERREFYSPSDDAVTYHGIDTPSRSVLFVLDVSGSMEQEVVERDKYKDKGYPSLRRIDIIKTELSRTIELFEPYVRFNILAYATEVDPWKKSLVKANVLNKSSAVTWISRLEALGGASKEDLARAGLVGSANLEAGKTNTYDALMQALAVAGKGAKKEKYEIEVDTIFFLSDGRPSHGKYVDPEDILDAVREANQLRRVVIHTIAIGEFQKWFMKRLAEENGGIFVDMGR